MVPSASGRWTPSADGNGPAPQALFHTGTDYATAIPAPEVSPIRRQNVAEPQYFALRLRRRGDVGGSRLADAVVGAAAGPGAIS